jgi:hypothetical protein
MTLDEIVRATWDLAQPIIDDEIEDDAEWFSRAELQEHIIAWIFKQKPTPVVQDVQSEILDWATEKGLDGIVDKYRGAA